MHQNMHQPLFHIYLHLTDILIFYMVPGGGLELLGHTDSR
jgi:hypothetical protein